MPAKRKKSAAVSEAFEASEAPEVSSVEEAAAEIVADEARESGVVPEPSAAWHPSPAGVLARRIALLLIVGGGIVAPMLVSNVANLRGSALALIYVMVGLSVNILMGYLGQISLGHQAFVGVGSFTAALMASKANAPFLLTLVGAGVIGALAAFLLGLVALRLKGLYLALITLAYGSVAQNTIFNTPSITGAGAGVEAIRPSFIEGDRAFVYFCMAIVAIVIYVDWRLVKSKAGRAIFAIRENELAAASFGINVTAYKLIAFVISGIIAGIAGAMFGYYVQSVDAGNYDFALALTFVLMVVVGGLGSRVGVFIGSAFFALLELLLHALFGSGFGKWLLDLPVLGGAFQSMELYPQVIGAVLLLLTLTLYPGGIAQQIKPLTGWLGGKRLHEKGQTVSIHEGGAGVRP